MNQRIDELTHAIAHGSAEALTQFYCEWFDWMYAAARSFTRRDEAFCLDVVQDSMLRVIKSIRRMQTREDLERWLTTVVRRAAIDRMRSDARRAARDQRPVEDAGNQPAMKSTTEEREWLSRAVRALDPRDQELIMARYRLELTFAQIAQLRGRGRGQTPGAAHGHISRVLAMLRRNAKEAFDAV